MFVQKLFGFRIKNLIILEYKVKCLFLLKSYYVWYCALNKTLKKSLTMHIYTLETEVCTGKSGHDSTAECVRMSSKKLV